MLPVGSSSTTIAMDASKLAMEAVSKVLSPVSVIHFRKDEKQSYEKYVVSHSM